SHGIVKFPPYATITHMFDKKHKKKFQGFFIVLSVLMIISMVVLYMPIFR
ncbi:MAG: hypothetical protein JWL80_295, partial [Parcubacteria group bacterium]|nr:hypothetical protein [Parcubacteria group bacterium]